MTREEIEQYRQATEKNAANKLSNYAKANGGPIAVGCFCKQANITRYITTFFIWFDNA
jgi:hypothetical protein